jgi:hypothetical protein
MKPLIKGIIIAVIQVGLVGSLGAKLLYDRTTLPRVWVQTVPYDPDLPIRGRYVRLQLVVAARGVPDAETPDKMYNRYPVALKVEDGRLTAEVMAEERRRGGPGRYVRQTMAGSERVTVLDEPVAFFIPEHIPDPSRRQAGEKLWVEATIPEKGPPRPIRLGVSNNEGPIMPLDIR